MELLKIFNLESLDTYSSEVKEQISIEAHYKGYLKKQDSEILSLKKDEKIKIPENIDYSEMSSLSMEIREKLSKLDLKRYLKHPELMELHLLH